MRELHRNPSVRNVEKSSEEKPRATYQVRENQRHNALFMFRKDMWLKKWANRLRILRVMMIYFVLLVLVQPFISHKLKSIIEIQPIYSPQALKEYVWRIVQENTTQKVQQYQEELLAPVKRYQETHRIEVEHRINQVKSIHSTMEYESALIMRQREMVQQKILDDWKAQLNQLETTCPNEFHANYLKKLLTDNVLDDDVCYCPLRICYLKYGKDETDVILDSMSMDNLFDPTV